MGNSLHDIQAHGSDLFVDNDAEQMLRDYLAEAKRRGLPTRVVTVVRDENSMRGTLRDGEIVAVVPTVLLGRSIDPPDKHHAKQHGVDWYCDDKLNFWCFSSYRSRPPVDGTWRMLARSNSSAVAFFTRFGPWYEFDVHKPTFESSSGTRWDRVTSVEDAREVLRKHYERQFEKTMTMEGDE